jgi:hypothetical protein
VEKARRRDQDRAGAPSGIPNWAAYKLHIWPYPTLMPAMKPARRRRRPGWAPRRWRSGGLPVYQLLAQENKILMPAAFSPLQ